MDLKEKWYDDVNWINPAHLERTLNWWGCTARVL